MGGFPELTIGEVARRAGVATSSIRYYERIGLLPEPDRSGGQRRYDADVLGKLGFIGVAQNAGFKLREIKQLLDGSNSLGEPMRSLSREKLGEVEALLERTKVMRRSLLPAPPGASRPGGPIVAPRHLRGAASRSLIVELRRDLFADVIRRS